MCWIPHANNAENFVLLWKNLKTVVGPELLGEAVQFAGSFLSQVFQDT